MRFSMSPWLFFLVVALAACSRNAVSLEYTNAEGEVARESNLQFRFSGDLAADSLLHKWISEDYIKFTPAIEGRFRWESPDVLVFSPSRPMPPATSFTASTTRKLLAHSKFNSLKNADKIQFHTPDLQLENVHVFWTLPANSTTPMANADLYFNYPIEPDAFQEKASLTLDENKARFQLLTTAASNKISLRLEGAGAEERDYRMTLSIGAGLKPVGGEKGTADIITHETLLPSPYELTIQDISSEHDGNLGTIFIKTSQQLSGERLADFVSLQPAVPFETTRTDDGLSISSEKFSAENIYNLTLRKGLKGIVGGTLKNEYSSAVAFGELEPSLSFANNKAIYLGRDGAKNIELKITNVARIKLVVSKVYENNLLAANRYGYYPRETRENESAQEEMDYEYGYDDESTLGDVVYEKEIDTRGLPKSGGGRLLLFNLADRLPEFKGIYHIRVRSTEKYWLSDERFISVSDIGLIAKHGAEKLYVFANSIKTTNPISGATIQVYGANNQLLGKGNTNSDGLAEISFLRQELAGFKPAMIIAKSTTDFNYLPFSTTRVNTSRFEIGGKRMNPSGLDAFIYPERDIYRPGEKMNFNVLVRNRNWQPPGEMPIKMKLTMPNGKELALLRKTLDAQGAAEGNVALSEAALTGSYLLEIFTGNDVLLGTRSIKVEEFLPDRIRVETKLNKEQATPGETLSLAIHALNYFGPPAANRKYECEIQVKEKAFKPNKYPNYHFAFGSDRTLFDKTVKTGTTNPAGMAEESFPIPAVFKNYGLLEARFFTTVFDETGRPVNRYATAELVTQPCFLGIGSNGYSYFPLRQTIRFPLLALGRNEQPVATDARIDIVKKEYRTIMAKSGSYFRYDSQLEENIVSSKTIRITGENTAFTFIPVVPGEYEIRATLPGSNAYVSQSFYSYGAWGNAEANFQVNTDGNIDIALDKEKYATGESVKALFKTPFDGRMLVTVETDQIISHQYLNVVNRSASITLKADARYLPNAYITATLIKPHQQDAIPLAVAHGFRNVRVEDRSRQMQVTIDAPKKSRSNTLQKVRIKTDPNAHFTLAAVDNGVLSVSNFKTPDPYAWFSAIRALDVAPYDLYPLLFPEKKRTISSTGGDADLALRQRMNTMPNKRVKLLSHWTGIRKADGRGQAEFDLPIPEFSGEVRLMVVSYKDNRVGAAEMKMTVADPLVISSGIPRFLSPGDTLDMPVTLSNTTESPSDVSVNLTVKGPLAALTELNDKVRVPARSEAAVVYRIAASNAIGAGQIKVNATMAGAAYTQTTDITVRPASTLQKRSGSETIAGGSSKTLTINTQGFVPSGSSFALTLSRSPLLSLGNQLDFLVNYPHGCTEQTISIAFPQLYVADLAEQVKSGRNTQATASYNVQEAIRKIKIRQLYNGAVTLWEDESSENWWTTAYAAHFLLEAKKAGYESDRSLLETMLNYLNMRLRNRETINYLYNRDQQRKIAPKELPYSLYVLALAGRPNLASMNFYKANRSELALDGKYLLAAAYAAAGDRTRFAELLPSSFAGEEAVAATGGSFYSDVRDMAIALNALVDADPSNPQIAGMARQLVEKFSKRQWYSTQECAFGLTAMGKIARVAAQSDATATILAAGKQVGRFTGAPLKLTQEQIKSNQLEIKSDGKGLIYAWWQSQGISADGSYREEDQYVKVRRSFYDRFGRPLSGNQFKQNDLVVVKITLQKSYAGNIDNMVITDLLPAGFELENPRIKDFPGTEWVKDAATPVHMDLRDDRIHFFTNIYGQVQHFYYVVRAVTPGAFRMGPVSADAMYNGDIHSYHGAGTIRIRQ